MAIKWKKYTLGELCYSVSETYRQHDDKVVLINTSDVLNGKILNHEEVENKNLKGQFKKTFKQNDILYSEIRPANKRFAYVDIENPFNYIASTKLMVLRSTDKILPKFLFILLTSEQIITYLQAMAETRSGTFPQITYGAELAPIIVNVPDIETQEKIVKILSALDEKIELNNKINENLHAQAQAIFKSWFVDFEPFGGSMPSNWEEVLLEDICTIQNGYAFKSNDYCKNGCKMVRVTNINDCYLENEDYINLPYSFYDDEKYRQFQLKSFDILLVMVGASVGKIGIVTEKDLPCLQNQNMWRFRSKNITISQPFIYFTVNMINKYVCGWSTGSARDFYRKDIFAKAKCILPSSEVLKKFNQIQVNLFTKISDNLLENQKLAQIRDTLLPKLMSGELEV